MCSVKQDPHLRIHTARLAWGNVEKLVIELIRMIQEIASVRLH
jgi:hypothetical protein